MTQLTILHTNDFHNHLSPAAAQQIKSVRARHPESILLDAGDAISAGNVGVRPGGEPILDVMNDLGYTAMTMGNREFHVADAFLRCKINRARFPVLCANMQWKDDSGIGLPVQSNLAVNASSLRVGIFGLTVPMVTERMRSKILSAFLFSDPLSAARRQIELLRPQVDILVLLSHLGIREDERLSVACPELDLIVGGHSHVVLPTPRTTGAVPIVQAGWFGRYLGVVQIDTSARRAVTGHLVDLKEG